MIMPYIYSENEVRHYINIAQSLRIALPPSIQWFVDNNDLYRTDSQDIQDFVRQVQAAQGKLHLIDEFSNQSQFSFDRERSNQQNNRIRIEIMELQNVLGIPDSPDRTAEWWSTPGNPESHLRDLRNEALRRATVREIVELQNILGIPDSPDRTAEWWGVLGNLESHLRDLRAEAARRAIVVVDEKIVGECRAQEDARREELNIFIQATRNILKIHSDKLRDAEQRARDGREATIFNAVDLADSERRRQALIRAEQEVLPLNERFRLYQEEEIRLKSQRLDQETMMRLQRERDMEEREQRRIYEIERERMSKVSESSEKRRKEERQEKDMLEFKKMADKLKLDIENANHLSILIEKNCASEDEISKHGEISRQLAEFGIGEGVEKTAISRRFDCIIDYWFDVQEEARKKSEEPGEFRNEYFIHYNNLRMSALRNLGIEMYDENEQDAKIRAAQPRMVA